MEKNGKKSGGLKENRPKEIILIVVLKLLWAIEL